MKALSPGLFRREFDELLTYLMGIPLILGIWILYFGWNRHLLIPGHDGMAFDLLFMTELSRVQGNWESFLYHPGILGGMKLLGVSGLPWILPLSLKLGLTPTAALNSFVFFIQAVYSFLGLKLVGSLLSLRRRKEISLPWSLRIPLSILFAFAPVLGWRLNYGHSTVAMGAQFFIVVLTGFISAIAGTTSLFLLLVSTLVTYTCFQSSMQQPIVYAIFFGAPLILGFFFAEKEERNAFPFWTQVAVKAVLPLLTGFLLALDRFSFLLAQTQTSDSARSLNSGSVVYSFLTGHFMDWLGSFLWTLDTARSGLPDSMDHEINYPMGPLLILFLVFFPWKTYWKAGLGVAVSILLIVTFSNDITPFSSAILTIFPPLRFFRVPTRSALVVALSLPILATAAFLHSFPQLPSMRAALNEDRQTLILEGFACFVLSMILLFISPFERELILWGLVISVSFLQLWLRRRIILPMTLLMVLGVGSILAFEERHLPAADSRIISAETQAIHGQIVSQAPDINFPLNRANLTFVLPAFGANTGNYLGVSSLSGYGFPLRRFLELVLAFSGERYDPTVANLMVPLQIAKYEPLRQLYNVKYTISMAPGPTFQVTSAGETAGPIWFGESLQPVNNFEALVVRLRELTGIAEVRAKGFIVKDDPAIPDVLRAGFSRPECRGAKVTEMGSNATHQHFEIGVMTPSECPLVISTNYSSQWFAYTTENGARKANLAVFPIDGALTGVMVPSGSSRVILETSTDIGLWARIGQGIGVFLLCLMIYLNLHMYVRQSVKT